MCFQKPVSMILQRPTHAAITNTKILSQTDNQAPGSNSPTPTLEMASNETTKVDVTIIGAGKLNRLAPDHDAYRRC